MLGQGGAGDLRRAPLSSLIRNIAAGQKTFRVDVARADACVLLAFSRGKMRLAEAQLKTLMIGSQDGDADCHAALLRAIAPMLKSFYGRPMRGDEEIEDLVQETLIVVHCRRATYDPRRPFTAWLFAIARNKMIDYFRRRKRLVQIEDMENILSAESFEQAVCARLDVDRLLDGLSTKQACAIRDTHISGFSVTEAANRSGWSESNVKISVHRGIKTMASRVACAR